MPYENNQKYNKLSLDEKEKINRLIDIENKEYNLKRDEAISTKMDKIEQEQKSSLEQFKNYKNKSVEQRIYYRRRKGGPVRPPLTEEQKRKIKQIDTKINNSKRQQRSLLYVWNYKLEHNCIKCGENHPAALVFHHKNPKEKHKEVPVMARKGMSIDSIQKEIDKCDVLCHNCHNILHWEMLNNFSSVAE